MNRKIAYKLAQGRRLHRFHVQPWLYAHASWLEGVSLEQAPRYLPEGMAAFGEHLYQESRIDPHDTSYLKADPLFLSILSLSQKDFHSFVHGMALAILKEDKSVMIQGHKLKMLAAFFTKFEMHLFLKDKSFLISLRPPVDFPAEITEEWCFEMVFGVLSFCFCSQSEALKKRLWLRFPKELAASYKHLSFDDAIYESLKAQIFYVASHTVPHVTWDELS